MTTVTLNLDDDVVEALRAQAARTGRSMDQIASKRLRDGESIFDRLRARPENDLDEDEAMQLALEEVAASREERRRGR